MARTKSSLGSMRPSVKIDFLGHLAFLVLCLVLGGMIWFGLAIIYMLGYG